MVMRLHEDANKDDSVHMKILHQIIGIPLTLPPAFMNEMMEIDGNTELDDGVMVLYIFWGIYKHCTVKINISVFAKK